MSTDVTDVCGNPLESAFTGTYTGSYNQLVQGDQAITCVYSDYSITYDGYTVTAITWI